jgi:Tfp pilus assembly protein PilV
MTNDARSLSARMTNHFRVAPSSFELRHSSVVRHSSFVVSSRSASGFTFVEVLAAFMFLAIQVPTILNAISVSSRASVIAERSAIAAQLAENKLNELTIDNTWTSAETRGEFGADWQGYRWELSQSAWDADNKTSGVTQLTLDAFFTVQGHEHSVRLTTLATQQTTTQSTSGSSSSSSTSTTPTR